MKIIKKLFCVIMAVVMLLSFAGCDKKRETQTEPTAPTKGLNEHPAEVESTSAIEIVETTVPAMPDTKVYAPEGYDNCIERDALEMQEIFQTAGFKNVVIVKEETLKAYEADKQGMVNNLAINGSTGFAKGDEFDENDEVIITQYALRKCNVTLNIDFYENWIFSRYNVKFKLNNDTQKVLNHGVSEEITFVVDQGKHMLCFENDEDSSVSGETEFEILGDAKISLKISCYNDHVSVEKIYFEDPGAVGENEIMLPAEGLNYEGKDYQAYAEELKAMGFTQIEVIPVYDLADNASNSGEIISVTVAGKSTFERGEIVPKNAAVAISYHLKESEDPVKKEQEEKKAKLEEEFPREMAKRAVVVAMTNCQATDVFKKDGNTYNKSKFHSYSDLSGFFLILKDEGVWTAEENGVWCVEGMLLEMFETSVYLKTSCRIKRNGDNYVVFNVDKTIASKEYIDSDDPARINTEELEPGKSHPYLTVAPKLISKDRDDQAVATKVLAKAARQNWIDSQFSFWKGKHTALCELIEENLHDPGSFDPEAAEYIDVNNEQMKTTVNKMLKKLKVKERVKVGDLLIIQEFTAKNLFNAKVKSVAYGIARESDNTITLVYIE